MADNNPITILADLQKLLSGPAHTIPQAMLDLVMTNTMGMAMHNAITAQHNAQTVNAAATTATCARILSVQSANSATIPQPHTNNNIEKAIPGKQNV